MNINNLIKSKHTYFWLMALAIVFGFTLPVLIQEGMFQDAVLYSCVSHNMSLGFGTFWFPQYSTLNLEGISSFHEQPPLIFGTLALLFKTLGSSMYVERLYVFITLILHIYLIQYFWKEIVKAKPLLQSMSWIPCLFWILIPICFWSFRGNMLENSMSLFTLGAVIVSFKNLKENRSIAWWLLAGILIFLASFSKGLPGLFPIGLPFIYWLIFREKAFSKIALYTIILLAVPVIVYFIFYLFPESRESLRIYVVERLLRRVSSMPTTDSRWETPWRLFQELIPILSITLVTFLATRKRIRRGNFTLYKKEAIFFLLIGLTAIIPLMLTMVQKGWYMVPGFPFLAIGLALFIAPTVTQWVKKIKVSKIGFKLFKAFSILSFLAVFILTAMQKGKISRHDDMVRDVYEIGKIVPHFATITVPEEMYYQYDFILQGFLVRHFNISISPEKEYQYYLKEKSIETTPPEGYVLVPANLETYDLYINKEREIKEKLAQPK
jgi:4-amino-4-deoxy-L-arabinose transferase-like glycosyltransferase